MPQKGSARLLTVAAGAAVVALITPAAHAATPAHHVHAAQVSASVARHESHNLHHNANLSSGNWSGYAANGASGSDTSVSSSWTQPAISCDSGGDTYSSFWVGLDGFNNSALEQTGTEADCIGGQAEYGAWWEVLPASESPYNVPVEPGDQLTATVTDNGGSFAMTLTDSTEGWSKTTNHAGSSGFQDSSAEVIAEATSVGGEIAQLSDFGSVGFSGSTANGSALGDAAPDEITMQNDQSGDVMAQPGGISGGSFGVTWENYS